MVEPNRDARSNDMTTWRAGCGGSRTSGSEGGPGKPATERLNRAPRPDPYTYIRTFSGWVYAAFVMDMYSRRIVGWQVSTSLHTTLALDALEMGLWNRDRIDQPSGSDSETADLIHHSDRGVQYRAVRYTERLEDAEVVASVGSKGDSYDNAAAEAFNSTFKSELIRNPHVLAENGHWRSIDDVEIAVAEWVDWYNTTRLHGSLDDLPPIEYETNYYADHVPSQPVGATP